MKVVVAEGWMTPSFVVKKKRMGNFRANRTTIKNGEVELKGANMRLNPFKGKKVRVTIEETE